MLPTRRYLKTQRLFNILLLSACVPVVLLVFCVSETRSQVAAENTAAQQVIARAESLCANWTEASFREAAQEYDKAAQILTSNSDFSSASHASRKSGDVYFALGEYDKSNKLYRDAETLAGKTNDWLAKATAFSQMGRLQIFVGNHELAQKQLTEALNLFRQHEADRSALAANAYGDALTNLAELNYAKGDFVNSLQQLESALATFQDHPKGKARVHLFMGFLAGSLGETEKAVPEITQALNLSRSANDKAGEASAITALGLWHSRTGEDDRAIEMHRQALEIFRVIGDRHSQAISLNALGQSHHNLGEYPIAIDEFKQALRLFQGIGSLDGAVSLFQIAMAHEGNGELDQAVDYYEQCLKLSRAAGKLRTEANALTQIAKVYVAQGSNQRAEKQFGKVLQFYQRINDRRGQATALNAYGEFLRKLGQTQRALEEFRRALPLSEQVGEQNILTTTLYNLAHTHFTLGAPDAALPFIQRSLGIIEDLRANVASPEFRVSYFSGVQKHYEMCIAVLMELDQRQPGSRFLTEAFLVSERGRARLLFDLVTESRTKLQSGVANELLDRERKLTGLLRVYSQYRMNLSLERKETAEIAEVDNQILKLRADYQQLQAELRQQQPRLFSAEHSPALNLRQIQNELLNSETILLEYSLGESRSYLWVITPSSIRAFTLPPRKVIEDAAREFYSLLTVRQNPEGKTAEDFKAADDLLTGKANELSEMLLGPLRDELGNHRLLVVPEGALQYIPFDLLPAPGAQERNVLVKTNEVVVLPSVSTLIAIRRTLKQASSTSKLVAVVADPVFSASDDRVQIENPEPGVTLAASQRVPQTMPEVLTRAGSLNRLGHATEEADAISRMAPWGTTMIAKGFQASRETAMSSTIGQYQIVHFATHGFLDTDHPELSGIVLTLVDRNGASTDGLMPLHDIYRLDLSAELTVLSACQTALGKEMRGEGLVGLSHGFISAGSKSVVASLWKVDDQATAFLMADFYESMLQKGMSPAAALRSAKLKMMQDKRWNAPYYWAGFVLQGEYANRIEVDHRSPLRIAVVVLFVLSVIGAGLLIVKKRKRQFPPPQSN
jgi:CHAT domain-containing protein/Tfp pilus assembly protein PilF